MRDHLDRDLSLNINKGDLHSFRYAIPALIACELNISDKHLCNSMCYSIYIIHLRSSDFAVNCPFKSRALIVIPNVTSI